ncbi:MAG: ABC transporter substrate-binding protein [Acutalibacteraceae bacterium]|nr:ABC transporter substrate-binding protein [Acutalibacteraceae bacterium]
MKIPLKLISLFLSVLLLISALSGCGSINKNAVIYYDATVVPKTLDPQLASNDTELLMIRNLFEGLMRVDENGEIVNGVISDYTFNNNVYTFNISETATWSDGQSVTAEDFVFAFKRAVDPATKSPYASKLSTILNAELILSGNIDAENLGVSAKSPSVFEVKLARNDNEFLYKLTTAVCMPCRKDFFDSCEGQYGLSKTHLLTNGSYRLTKWNTQDFAARLHRNDKYYGRFAAKNSAIFISYNPDAENLEKLSKSSVDISFIKMDQLDESASLNLKNAQYQNVVWVMEFSEKLPFDLRRAFIHAIDRSSYAGDLGIGYNISYSLFPPSLVEENMDYIGMHSYNLNEARKLFNSSLLDLPNQKLPSTTLIYYNDEDMKVPINDIVGHWQNNLGAYINMQPSDSLSEIKTNLANGTNTIAIYPVTITDKDPSVFCYQLGFDYANTSIKTINAIQTNIMSHYKIVPIAFENSVIAYQSEIVDFNFGLGNGLIDFAYVTKK